MSVSDQQALQKIIDSKGSSTPEKLKAVELKARIAGRIGTGKGDQPLSDMTRMELTAFVDACVEELERRKALT